MSSFNSSPTDQPLGRTIVVSNESQAQDLENNLPADEKPRVYTSHQEKGSGIRVTAAVAEDVFVQTEGGPDYRGVGFMGAVILLLLVFWL